MAENSKEPNKEPEQLMSCTGISILFILGIIFLVKAFSDGDGLFAIASAVCFVGLRKF